MSDGGLQPKETWAVKLTRSDSKGVRRSEFYSLQSAQGCRDKRRFVPNEEQADWFFGPEGRTEANRIAEMIGAVAVRVGEIAVQHGLPAELDQDDGSTV
jgi:hypothetical protein